MQTGLAILGALLATGAVIYAAVSFEYQRTAQRVESYRRVLAATGEVRDAAERVRLAHEAQKTGRDEGRAARAAFAAAQHRLRVVYSSEHLPRRLRRREPLRAGFEALLAGRVWEALVWAPRLLNDTRHLRVERWRWLTLGLRRRDARDRLARQEDAIIPPRPFGGFVALGPERTRSLEMVRPHPVAGLVRRARDDEVRASDWSARERLAERLGKVDAAAVIRSGFADVARLDVVARLGDRLTHLRLCDGAAVVVCETVASGVAGVPTMIHGGFGLRGNFEVVVPRRDGGLLHLWCDNDDRAMSWHASLPFLEDEQVASVALVQSNYGSGHLELIARIRGELVPLWRDDGVKTWKPEDPLPLADGPAAGVPAFIQSSRNGAQGNFEVVTPLAGGGLAHLWRDNDLPSLPWRQSPVFGDRECRFDAVALVESRLRSPNRGKLHAIALADDEPRQYTRRGKEWVEVHLGARVAAPAWPRERDWRPGAPPHPSAGGALLREITQPRSPGPG
jgi:hypothetical protein